MAEPSQHINYSFEDIQRYLQGKMPAAEMHAVEKAALQDPFLADAIEGFNEADFTVAKQHLNEINAGLFAEKKENKVVAFNKRTQWLNIAAIIIVLAGIGVTVSYFFNATSSNQQTSIAKAPKASTERDIIIDSLAAETLKAPIKQPDSTSFLAENRAAKKPRLSSANRKSGKASYKNTSKDNPGAEEAMAFSSAASTPVVDTVGLVLEPAKTPAAEKTIVSRSYSDGFTDLSKTDSSPVAVQGALQGRVAGLTVAASPANFTGTVIDQNGAPVPFTTIQVVNSTTAVAADEKGFFNIPRKDSLLEVTATNVGYPPAKYILKRGVANQIVLPPGGGTFNEVVVTGYGMKRKGLNDKPTLPQADSAMPVGGWNNFNHYVITQLNKDTTTDAITNPQDIVEMEFLVDKAGNPTDIKVVKSPNEQSSSKAVEILKSGPKWTTPAKKKKAKVVIKF